MQQAIQGVRKARAFAGELDAGRHTIEVANVRLNPHRGGVARTRSGFQNRD